MYTLFDSISFNIDEVFSINPSANVFVFGEFNVHHKDWLIYAGRTHRYKELCYNFSISNNLTQMFGFPTRIPDYDYHSPALLNLLISSDGLFPVGNFNHLVVSVSKDFPLYLHRNTMFNCIDYDYSCSDWDGLSDYLRDVPWEDIFKLSACAAAKEFCEWA